MKGLSVRGLDTASATQLNERQHDQRDLYWIVSYNWGIFDDVLRQAAGQAFYSSSRFTLSDLCARANRQQPMGHSPLDIRTPKELGHDE